MASGAVHRYHGADGAVEWRSETLRAFRRLTHGLRSRLRVPSLASMCAGRAPNPLGRVAGFLVEGRRIGLTREWGEAVAAFVQSVVDAEWSDQQVSDAYLFERDQRRENEGNSLTLHYLLLQHPTPADREHLCSQLEIEVSAKRALLAGLRSGRAA